ncbi:MAG: radical SAM protein [Negativicutes bacterium]|nr:radical SAM protein [Negativicutes bacterium]
MPHLNLGIETTSTCQLGCKFCYNQHQMDCHQKIPMETLRELLRQITSNSIHFRRITLTGGEPFTSMDTLMFILSEYKDVTDDIRINTNMQKMTEDIADEIIKANRNAFCFSSLIATNKEAFDDITGVTGSFNTLKKSIKTATSRGLHCALSLIINKETFDHKSILQFVDLCREYNIQHAGVKKMRLPLSGSAENFSYVSKILPSVEEYIKGIDYLLEECNKYNILVSCGEPVAMCHYPDDAKYSRLVHQCGVSNLASAVVSTHGGVRPCPFLPLSYEMGNIFTDGFVAAINNLETYFQNILDNHECNGVCEHFNTSKCAGGCYVDTLAHGLKITDKAPFSFGVTKYVNL